MLRTLLSTGSRLAAQDVRVAFQGMSAIHTSSSAGMGMGSHASDNDPDVLHREKQKNLSGESKSAVPGMGEGWNEKLASDSEAAVKSDRHVDDDHNIEELQHHTVKHIRREHHEEDEAAGYPPLET